MSYFFAQNVHTNKLQKRYKIKKKGRNGKMTAEAAEAKRNYMREYRKRNRIRLNEYRKKWAKENPEKVKAYMERQWERKAKEKM